MARVVQFAALDHVQVAGRRVQEPEPVGLELGAAEFRKVGPLHDAEPLPALELLARLLLILGAAADELRGVRIEHGSGSH